ncbi:hypothetical protein P8452_21552 [Trifolium repens]|nr:hypothetical protein P8452_21552 [Trifolium repens]
MQVPKTVTTRKKLCNRRGYPVNKTDSSSFDVCSSPPSTSAFRRRRSSTRHRHCSSSTQMVPKMAHQSMKPKI